MFKLNLLPEGNLESDPKGDAMVRIVEQHGEDMLDARTVLLPLLRDRVLMEEIIGLSLIELSRRNDVPFDEIVAQSIKSKVPGEAGEKHAAAYLENRTAEKKRIRAIMDDFSRRSADEAWFE